MTSDSDNKIRNHIESDPFSSRVRQVRVMRREPRVGVVVRIGLELTHLKSSGELKHPGPSSSRSFGLRDGAAVNQRAK